MNTDSLGLEEKPNHVDMWYDKHTRLWVVQLKDINNNQVGKASYVYGKEGALREKKELEEYYSLEL